jgi:hypothetical protein
MINARPTTIGAIQNQCLAVLKYFVILLSPFLREALFVETSVAQRPMAITALTALIPWDERPIAEGPLVQQRSLAQRGRGLLKSQWFEGCQDAAIHYHGSFAPRE